MKWEMFHLYAACFCGSPHITNFTVHTLENVSMPNSILEGRMSTHSYLLACLA